MTDYVYVVKWDRMRPDQREFRQNSVEFVPSVYNSVGIPVPITAENFTNFDKLLGLTSDQPALPILTPIGIKFVLQQLENVFPENKIVAETAVPWDTKDDPVWDDDKSTKKEEKVVWDDDNEKTEDNWNANEEEW
jgi:hypothetical protein